VECEFSNLDFLNFIQHLERTTILSDLTVEMVRFQYIYAVASDGRAKLNGLENGPTKEQQQQNWKKGRDGKVSMDYYRQLSRTDGKYMDWLQKLGCMAAKELMKDEWGQ
jgi:hypothetical protein